MLPRVRARVTVCSGAQNDGQPWLLAILLYLCGYFYSNQTSTWARRHYTLHTPETASTLFATSPRVNILELFHANTAYVRTTIHM